MRPHHTFLFLRFVLTNQPPTLWHFSTSCPPEYNTWLASQHPLAAATQSTTDTSHPSFPSLSE